MLCRGGGIALALISLALPLWGTEPAASTEDENQGIDWGRLLTQSLEFLAVEHSYRYLTEAETRNPHQPFFQGYVESLNKLHGWSDGDPFLVNYVGHPMQGAVTGFLFVDNDRRYRTAVFGRNREYWKSRLRAAAFAWGYSEQFEAGLLSESSIGNIPAKYPAQGFVDHLVTPSVGLGWMIAEDAIDKYVIDPLDFRFTNQFARAAFRATLNPSRSMANFVGWHLPWYRATRTGDVQIHDMQRMPRPRRREAHPPPGVAPFEAYFNSNAEQFFRSGSHGECAGGGASLAFRAAEHWQVVGTVNGCKLVGLPDHTTGDSLTYMLGSRWSPRPNARWSPYVQLLAGGRTVTHEIVDPVKEAQLKRVYGSPLPNEVHSLYATPVESTGFAFSAGGGVDLKLTNALALRAAAVNYTWTGHATIDQISYSHSLGLTTGLILRMGTW